jgi:drug/metabolite transporter (DMT)-like permease
VIYFLLRSFLGPKSIPSTSPAALRFRVLFTDPGCLTGDTGSGSGRWRGLLAGAGCLTSEFANTFATIDTTSVAVAIALITSPLLAIAYPAL